MALDVGSRLSHHEIVSAECIAEGGRALSLIAASVFTGKLA
jgi:hypothetical protein